MEKEYVARLKNQREKVSLWFYVDWGFVLKIRYDLGWFKEERHLFKGKGSRSQDSQQSNKKLRIKLSVALLTQRREQKFHELECRLEAPVGQLIEPKWGFTRSIKIAINTP